MSDEPLESTTSGRRVMKLYVYSGLIIVALMMLAGITMRAEQAGWASGVSAGLFYALLTLHGAGMIVGLLLCGMGALWYLMCRHIHMSAPLAALACILQVVGVIGIVIATLFGGFAALYTFLDPLPYHGTWPDWSTGLFLISMGLVCAGWVIWSLQMLGGVMRAYGGLRGAMGWDFVFFHKSFTAAGRHPPPPEAFPALLSGIDGIIAGMAGMVLMVALIVRWLDPRVKIDPLWAKNLTYFFGHTIANVIIYMLAATIYVGIPYAAGRKYHTSIVLAIAWWTSTTLTMTNYFHHMYMDFAQPHAMSFFGEWSSYMSSLPVVVVTVFSALMIVWRSRTRWGLGAIFMYSGMVGWVVGGIAAEIDATIPFNTHLHNTLWVPAHFHTYLLGGCLLFAVGWVFLLLESRSRRRTSMFFRWVICTLVFGGMAVFLAGFYAAGAMGVPRRYAGYIFTGMPIGQLFAQIATIGAAVMIIGFILLFIEGLWLRLHRLTAMPSSPQPLVESIS